MTPFEAVVGQLGRDALMKLMEGRHSVRQYSPEPIEGAALEALEHEIQACNAQSGLSIQLIVDNPDAFNGRLAHYGSFREVRNHIALVGPAGPGLDEACGYYGERLVLLAQAMGLNTCWVAMTFSKKASEARVAPGEKYALCIAVGHGETAGAAHKVKPAEKLFQASGAVPAWFAAGVEAARLAPTAMNQQRFRFDLGEDGLTVRAIALPAISCGKVDLGIAKLHFELGANAVSRDWRFA